jgi:hypothetical protein
MCQARFAIQEILQPVSSGRRKLQRVIYVKNLSLAITCALGEVGFRCPDLPNNFSYSLRSPFL